VEVAAMAIAVSQSGEEEKRSPAYFKKKNTNSDI
jgi:hypothetical protein